MKKVINNKVYDTSTARLIADVPHTDINKCIKARKDAEKSHSGGFF